MTLALEDAVGDAVAAQEQMKTLQEQAKMAQEQTKMLQGQAVKLQETARVALAKEYTAQEEARSLAAELATVRGVMRSLLTASECVAGSGRSVMPSGVARTKATAVFPSGESTAYTGDNAPQLPSPTTTASAPAHFSDAPLAQTSAQEPVLAAPRPPTVSAARKRRLLADDELLPERAVPSLANAPSRFPAVQTDTEPYPAARRRAPPLPTRRRYAPRSLLTELPNRRTPSTPTPLSMRTRFPDRLPSPIHVPFASSPMLTSLSTSPACAPVPFARQTHAPSPPSPMTPLSSSLLSMIAEGSSVSPNTRRTPNMTSPDIPEQSAPSDDSRSICIHSKRTQIATEHEITGPISKRTRRRRRYA